MRSSSGSNLERVTCFKFEFSAACRSVAKIPPIGLEAQRKFRPSGACGSFIKSQHDFIRGF